ncbi:MAG TPA: hypothetical protein VF187_08665 [Gemmatimonadales bacterium]|jgi:hypothetical protein
MPDHEGRKPAETTRPDSPELETGVPLPEELTGRASKTEEDLKSLFASKSEEHLEDGFKGGSGDEPIPDATGSSE